MTAISLTGIRISILDLLHSAMIAAASYMYFVNHFGEMDVTDQVFWYVVDRRAALSCSCRSCCRTIGVSAISHSKTSGLLTVE